MANDDSPVNPFQPGTSWQIFFNENNLNNRTIHIRAVVDDEYIVYCTWWSGRQSWEYRVEHRSYLDMLLREGFIKKARNRYGLRSQD